MLIRYNGQIYRVVEYQHIAPGNWRAMVRMKLKNFETGKVIEDRVRAGSDIEIVKTETRTATYLYRDGDMFHFMDAEDFEQLALPAELIEDEMVFVRENEQVSLLKQDDGKILSVEPPTFVTLKVTSADVAVRGDTATSVQKNATLETGAVIRVPDFIKEGDSVRIDTRTGEYLERG
jgi:elongation factor P